jgi:hypothetical protein
MRTATALSALTASLLTATAGLAQHEPVFNRAATFPVVRNLAAGGDPAKKAVAEIVSASEDGRTLVYANSERDAFGFLDITDPTSPQQAGEIPVGGEPTSVTVAGSQALVVVSTSKDKKAPAGYLGAADLASKRMGVQCQLDGQPDSITRSRDGRFAVIAIENERDETLDKGKIPQPPAGELKIVPLMNGVPDCAAMRSVALTGLAAVAGDDPEPEFVDVNGRNEAVVTLQENNHVVIVRLEDGRILHHFAAGSVSLSDVDSKRDGVISATGRLEGLAREPDAVRWLDDERFVIANEGDYQGGSRGFTIFNRSGAVEWDSGNALEHLAMRLGHYPERRAGSKGVEPEGIEVARFGEATYIFVGMERASLIAVYRDRGPGQAPDYVQALPTGAAPEGLLALPARDLFVSASEADDLETGARSVITIYRRGPGPAAYPTIVSDNASSGAPIAWGALSGLSIDPSNPARLYAVTDSFYSQGKVLSLDVSATPARIVAETVVTRDGKPAGLLDLEGVTARPAGGFWLASEGNPERKEGPTESLLVRVAPDGAILEEIPLPEAVKARATRFGYEGVAVTGEGAEERVWLALQREWKDDPKGLVKIAVYTPGSKAWGFLHYPIEAAERGWVGLSDLTPAGDGSFIVLERDNQIGDLARVKRLYRISTAGVAPAQAGQPIPVLKKALVRDLLADLRAGGGAVIEKVEGFAMSGNGEAYAVTDNDGVDGSSGETQFLRLGRISATQ